MTWLTFGSNNFKMHFEFGNIYLTQEMQKDWSMNIKQNVMSHTLTKKYLLTRFRKKFPADLLLIWQICTAMSANDPINFWEQTILK